MGKFTLLLIDPQVDFHPGGSLGIANAGGDSERTADFILDHLEDIDQILVTLDSHHRMHIAHSMVWVDKDGNHPPPFTTITNKDIQEGTWMPSEKAYKEHCLSYTKQLEAKGRFTLCIWPEHCLIGTPGHNVVPPINSALRKWEYHHFKTVEFIQKGSNCDTEMYSAIIAEVPMREDMSTHLNSKLLQKLHACPQLVVCGQALSHCVNFTVRDIVDNWRGENSKIVVLEDASSPVEGFESAASEFLEDMKFAGVTITKTTDFLVKSHK